MQEGNPNVVLPHEDGPEFYDICATGVAYRRFPALVGEAIVAGLEPTTTTLTLEEGLAAIFTAPGRYAFIEVLSDGTTQALVSDCKTETICWQFTPDESLSAFERIKQYLN